jgi:hypothetical protein
MLKPYEVTVIYRIYALNETDAITLAELKGVAPETIDVLELPDYKTPKIDIVDF